MRLADSLTLVGRPRPIARDVLATALADDFAAVPDDYVELMTTWGAGALWGCVELFDPTEPRGQLAQLRDRWRVFGRKALGKDAYKLFADGRPRGVVIGLAAGRGCGRGRPIYGAAIVAREREPFVIQHDGAVAQLGSIETMTTHLSERYADDGIRAIYVTEPPAPDMLVNALAQGDEAAADVAIGTLVDAGVAVDVLLVQLEQLARAGGRVAPGLRASYVDQLFRMAKRRAPEIVTQVAIRELVGRLASGSEPTAEMLCDISSLVPPPQGVFHMRLDDRETELVAKLAARPEASDDRRALAVRLAESGRTELAEHVRAPPSPPPAPQPAVNDPEVSNAAFPNLHGPEALAMTIERWRQLDPATSIDAIVAACAALSPEVQQRYMLHLAQAEATYIDHREQVSRRRLVAEAATAWPILVLGLRWSALAAARVLKAVHARHAAPFVLSVVRRPDYIDEDHLALAEAYAAFGKLTAEMVDELLRYFETDARPPAGATVAHMQQVAFRMLRNSVTDDRVLMLYLDHFVRAHPYAERALLKRRDDPRVLPALLAGLAREEASATRDGRFIRPSDHYGFYAKLLARLGNERGLDATKRFEAHQRHLRRLNDE